LTRLSKICMHLFWCQREKVEQCLLKSTRDSAVLCNNLKKVYSGKDGNPQKLAVRGLSLALPQGECFGMLGPNGAGKTSFINMVRINNIIPIDLLSNESILNLLVNLFDILMFCVDDRNHQTIVWHSICPRS